MVFSPNIFFFIFSNKQTLDKNKKIFRPTDPIFFRHVSGNTDIFRPYFKVLHVCGAIWSVKCSPVTVQCFTY